MNPESNEQTQLLREILKWIRFAGMKEVKAALSSALDSETKKIIYHLSGGEKGSIEIAKAAGVSDFTVRKYWKSWAKFGIVESMKVGRGERYRKAFELEDFGIEVPQPKSIIEKKELIETRKPNSQEVKESD